MAIVGISEPSRAARKWAPLALAFRPFFLLAGLSAVLLIAFWGHAFGKGMMASRYYDLIGWHSHEMLFGYAAAVISGFLLTAARNWTGVQTLKGWPLALLALLWLAGRLAAVLPVPAGLLAVLDVAFLPCMALALWLPLWKVRQSKNYIFVALVLGMALGNVLVHLQLGGVTAQTAHAGTYLGLGMILLVIVLMGGRVIPFFTEKGLGVPFERREWRWVEWLTPVSIFCWALAEGFLPGSGLAALAAAFAALVNGLRLAGWYTPAIWRVPLIWVLQLGYAWLVTGLALVALSAVLDFSSLLALHALTIGGFGGITLGMMARVSLGHTGRTLVTPKAMPWAFVLLNLAVVVRVFMPMLLPTYTLSVMISALLWALVFALYVWGYGLMLLRPRIDGAPG